jgi:hypothetical protein
MSAEVAAAVGIVVRGFHWLQIPVRLKARRSGTRIHQPLNSQSCLPLQPEVNYAAPADLLWGQRESERHHMTTPSPAQPTLKIDRSVLTCDDNFDDPEQRLWWHRQPPETRLQHMLALRKMNYGDESSARLQRVLEIAELPPR